MQRLCSVFDTCTIITAWCSTGSSRQFLCFDTTTCFPQPFGAPFTYGQRKFIRQRHSSSSPLWGSDIHQPTRVSFYHRFRLSCWFCNAVMLDCGRHICVFVLLDHASTFYALTPVIFFCSLSMGKNVLSYVLYLFGHSVVCKSYQVVFILVSIERTPTHCGQAATIQPSEEITVFSRTHIFRTCKAKRVPLSLSHFYVLYQTSLFLQ